MTPTAGPLVGIRVLELGNFIAAPFAGKVFAEFGAEVIKIERPGAGDELRGWRTLRGDTSMMFRTIGRNKRSVTLDLRTDRGRQIALRLAASSDVLLENFRPGTLEKWGLGPDVLMTANPDLVVVRISGYGQTGPYRDRAGFGGVAEAFDGLRSITGYPDREPARAAASVGDTVAGLYGAIGALMVLLRKARAHSADSDGVDIDSSDTAGQLVDVALYEAVFSILESLVPDFDAYGVVRQRSGGKLPGVVPSDVYQCKDGKAIVIGGNSNAVFARMMRAIGRADLADDPQLADGPGRSARADELERIICDWAGSVTMDQAMAVLDGAGVPAGGVLDAESIGADPQFAARRMLQTMPVRVEREIEQVRFPGIVPKIDGNPEAPRWVGPEVGEHTDDVLTRLCGVRPDELQALREEKVI